jgi:hypothetical protein
MRIDIVAANQISNLAVCDKALCQFCSKKLPQYGNALRLCDSGGAVCWLNTQTGNAPLNKVTQQIAVIGSNLDHKRIDG